MTLAAYFNLSPEKQLDGITIFSDSRSALQALSKGLSNLVLDIISLLVRVNSLKKMYAAKDPCSFGPGIE